VKLETKDRQMLNFRSCFFIFSFLLLTFIIFFSVSVYGQDQSAEDRLWGNSYISSDSEQLFSPYNAQTFHQIAYELYTNGQPDSSKVSQSLVFLMAAGSLDNRAKYLLPDIIKIASQYPRKEYFTMVYQSLLSYADVSADLSVTKLAVSYLLEQLDSREKRENLLRDLLKNLGDKNPMLSSELATQLALLEVEKTDFSTAESLLLQAYSANNYNKLAFAKLNELADVAKDTNQPLQAGAKQVPPTMYARHLRLAIGKNRLDLKAAFAFAQYAEMLQVYDVAAGVYEYCADLFAYLYPGKPIPASIYLPWAITNYNTMRNQHKCLEIARMVRQTGQFDIYLESIAAKAALAMGDAKQSAQILDSAEQKAVKLFAQKASNDKLSSEHLAWFHCFAKPNPEQALAWANRAYSAEPNSVMASAILAYALANNQQHQLAKSLITESFKDNQIAAIAMALIQLQEGQKADAIESLKAAIAADVGSIEAERARAILAENGSEYIAPIDPDTILLTLKEEFGNNLVPKFVSADEIVSVELKFSGTEFSYGSDIRGRLVITNTGSETFIIGDDGLLKGEVRVDADISGDLQMEIANLISSRFEPSAPVEPGRSFFLPLRLSTGKLKQILSRFPQASLEIKFTVYVDPVISADGKVHNAIVDIKPAVQVIKRTSVKLSRQYLQNKINALSKGHPKQKVKSAQLLIGLLMEQLAMSGTKPYYSYKYAEPVWLKSALKQSLADDNWTVKVQTMLALIDYPMDYELIKAGAVNLNDTDWPVRMTALFLLARSRGPNYQEVLNWYAKYDSNEFVRSMAVALGGVEPEQPKNLPHEQPIVEPNQTK